MTKFDVIVVGGGTAGACAAIAAGRHGARTLIVEQFGFLGGSQTGALVVPIMNFSTSKESLVRGLNAEIISRCDALGNADSSCSGIVIRSICGVAVSVTNSPRGFELILVGGFHHGPGGDSLGPNHTRQVVEGGESTGDVFGSGESDSGGGRQVSGDGKHGNTSVLTLNSTTTLEVLGLSIEPSERIVDSKGIGSSKLELVYIKRGGDLGGRSRGKSGCRCN